MERTVLAIVLGLAVAIVTMLLLEYVGMSLFPLPAGLDLEDEQDLVQLVASAGLGKQLWVLAGWTLAAALGGWTAAKLARHRTPAALCVGALVVAGVLINISLLPHPAWMSVLGALLPLPVAWAGARLATPRPPSSSTP